jgi:hypothetical protein
MYSVEKRGLVVVDGRLPLTGPDRVLELPDVDLDYIRIEPELSAGREYDIASERVSDRIDGLIEGMPSKRARAFRPEIRLDPIARAPLPAGDGEYREKAQRPFLLRGYRDRACVCPQGKRSQHLEDEHFPLGSPSDLCVSFF